MFFLENENGEAIGTATAWFGDLDGERISRIHWVGIVPEHQGKRLAKPLLVFLLQQLAHKHEKAYLKTQTTNLIAINAYMNLGFVPLTKDKTKADIWETVKAELRNIKK